MASYTPDQVQEITTLRCERWACLAVISETGDTDKQLSKRMTSRLDHIGQELHTLTGNPIYLKR